MTSPDPRELANELAQISGRCSVKRDRETIIKAVSALRSPSPYSGAAGEALTGDGAKQAAEALCDWADNNLSMFEACSEENPVKAQELYDTAKRLRDMLKGEFAPPTLPRDAERETIARIIDPTAFNMKPSAYGLKTTQEMLNRTLVGAVRTVAYEKADAILALPSLPPREGMERETIKDGDALLTDLIWEVDRAVKQAGGKGEYDTVIRHILNKHLFNCGPLAEGPVQSATEQADASRDHPVREQGE